MARKESSKFPRWFAVAYAVLSAAVCLSFLTPHPLYLLPAGGRPPFLILIVWSAAYIVVAAFRPDLISENVFKTQSVGVVANAIVFTGASAWLSFAGIASVKAGDYRLPLFWPAAIVSVAVALALSVRLLYLFVGHARR
jgi:hypothetical protein